MRAKHLKRLVQFIIALGLTLLLGWFLLSQITWMDLKETYHRMDKTVIFFCFIIYCLTHLCRAGRYYHMLDKKIKYWDMVTLTAAHNMFTSLLPFRTGELSFPLLLKKRSIKITHSLTGLGVGRIFDFYIVCLFFLLAVALSYRILPESLIQFVPYAIGLIIAIIIISLMVITHASKVAQFLTARKQRWLVWFGHKMEEMAIGFRNIHTVRMISFVAFFTFLTWLLQFAWTYWLLSYLFNVNFWVIVVGSSVAFISTAIPIQGLGNLGTLEYVWRYSFGAVGITPKLAISSGFVFHAINIVFAIGAGLIGLVFFLRHKPATQTQVKGKA